MEMSTLRSSSAGKEDSTQVQSTYTDHVDRVTSQASTAGPSEIHDEGARLNGEEQEYRVYKIRWFGLLQLVLLNIIVSWDVGRS